MCAVGWMETSLCFTKQGFISGMVVEPFSFFNHRRVIIVTAGIGKLLSLIEYQGVKERG